MPQHGSHWRETNESLDQMLTESQRQTKPCRKSQAHRHRRRQCRNQEPYHVSYPPIIPLNHETGSLGRHRRRHRRRLYKLILRKRHHRPATHTISSPKGAISESVRLPPIKSTNKTPKPLLSLSQGISPLSPPRPPSPLYVLSRPRANDRRRPELTASAAASRA